MTNVPYHVHEFAIPTPSEAEARAGTSTSSAMHPLATKQSIDAEVGVTIASAAQGLLAGTALQPNDVSAVAISGDYDDLLNKPDVTSVTQQNFSVVAGQTSVTISGGYVIGRVYQVFLNGILLDNGTWSASNGSTVTFAAITNADIIEGESSASLTVAIGAASILIPALDARYQRIISDPEKNLLQRGFKEGDQWAAANTAIFNEAGEELTGNFGAIFLPVGQYTINEDLEPLTDFTGYVRGQGKAASRLLVVPKSGNLAVPVAAGIRFNLSSLGYTVGVGDISIYIRGISTQAAVRIERPDDQNSGGFAGPIVSNVEVRGETIGYGFTHGLWLNNGWNARVVNFDDMGSFVGATPYDFISMSGASIILDGNSTAVVMDQVHSTHRNHGLLTLEGSFSEGAKLLHSEFVNVNRGVVANSAVGAPEGSSPPGMTIDDCHFAVNQTAIEVVLRPQVQITKTLIYNRIGGYAISPDIPPEDLSFLQTKASEFLAIYGENMNQSQVENNIALGFGRGTFFSGQTCVRTTVGGNKIEDFETGLNGNNSGKLWDPGTNAYYSTPNKRVAWAGSLVGIPADGLFSWGE